MVDIRHIEPDTLTEANQKAITMIADIVTKTARTAVQSGADPLIVMASALHAIGNVCGQVAQQNRALETQELMQIQIAALQNFSAGFAKGQKEMADYIKEHSQ